MAYYSSITSRVYHNFIIPDRVRAANHWSDIRNADLSTAKYVIEEWGDLVYHPMQSFDEIYDILTSEAADANVEGDWANRMIEYVHNGIVSYPMKFREMIPCLNILDRTEMKKLNGRVVRFRGMVQEMFDPVMYKTRLPVRQTNSEGVSRVVKKCALYKEFVSMSDGDEEMTVDEESDTSDLREMEQLHVISVPGESLWIQNMDQPYTPCCANEELEEQLQQMSMEDSMSEVRIPLAQKAATLCYPVPSMLEDVRNKAVIMKIYKSPHGIRMNDVIEFYGILSIDDNNQQPDEIRNTEYFNQADDATAEELIRNPSSTLVPRMHVLGYFKLNGNDQDAEYIHMGSYPIVSSPSKEEHEALHIMLFDILTDTLMGDKVSAEFVLCNILSHVYTRVEGKPFGSIALSLWKFPPNVCKFLVEVLQLLLMQCVYIKDFPKTLRTTDFVPRKDYRCNKLMSGLLQLSAGTHLIINLPKDAEATISESTDPKVCGNLEALRTLIESQEVAYDFKYNPLKFQHDIPILILKDGGKKYNLFGELTTNHPFYQCIETDRYEKEVKPKVRELLSDLILLSKLRNFIIIAKRSGQFMMSDSLEQVIVKQFEESRRQESGSSRMGTKDLHRRLTLARYMMKSKGETQLSSDTWEIVTEMETGRAWRLNPPRMRDPRFRIYTSSCRPPPDAREFLPEDSD